MGERGISTQNRHAYAALALLLVVASMIAMTLQRHYEAGAATVAPGALTHPVGAAPLGSTVGTPPANALVVSPAGNNANPGTAAQPLATLAAAVSKAAATGTTIVLRAGTYHESVQVYQKAVTIEAWPDEQVWLDGSVPVTGFVTASGHWRHDGWVSTFPITTHATNPIVATAHPEAGYPDQVFRDGTPLRQVLTSAELVAGTFYIDRASSQLWLGDDPTGHQIAASNLEWALYFNKANDSKLIGIGVRRYATSPANMAAVRAYADRVLLDNVVIRDTALSGVSFIGTGSIIRDSTIDDAGFIGIHGNNADSLSVLRTLVENSNAAGFDALNSAAGLKLTRTRDPRIEASEFADNAGPGVWTDQDSYDVQVLRNYIHGSSRSGVEIELTGKGDIAGNAITDSGENGVWILDSNDMAVWNNTIVRSTLRGINVWDGPRIATNVTSSDHDPRFPAPQPGITWTTIDISIRNNVLVVDSGASTAMISADDQAHTSNATASRISSDYNAFYRAAATVPQYVGIWAAAPSGTKTGATLGAFTSASGQDTHSVSVNGGPDPFVVNAAARDFRVVGGAPHGTTLTSTLATLLGASGTTPVGVLEGPVTTPPTTTVPPTTTATTTTTIPATTTVPTTTPPTTTPPTTVPPTTVPPTTTTTVPPTTTTTVPPTTTTVPPTTTTTVPPTTTTTVPPTTTTTVPPTTTTTTEPPTTTTTEATPPPETTTTTEPTTPTTPPPVADTPAPARSGYQMLGVDGAVYAFGDAADLGDAPGLAVGIATTADGSGYWVTDAAGQVAAFGSAVKVGQPPALVPGERVSTISATPSGKGYWLFTNQGHAFVYGDAHYYGDLTGVSLNGPIVASVPTVNGRGYYMVGSDGGIFAFGNAKFHGSMGRKHINKPVVGIAPTRNGRGYWLVGSDGGVFAFHAPFRGSAGGTKLNKPVNGLVSFGNGYLMVASDGGVFNYSNKPFDGSLASTPPPAPIIGIAAFAH